LQDIGLTSTTSAPMKMHYQNEQIVSADAEPKQQHLVDSKYPHFSPANYLIGIVLHAIESHKNVQISLPSQGEIFVWAHEEVYAANIKTEEFWRAPADQFQVTAIEENAGGLECNSMRPLHELLWSATFHASQGKLIDGCHKFDVVQFKRWPNLTRLPCTPNATRICAALVAHPITIMILRAMLKIDTAEICQIYSAAYIAGVANVLNRKKSETGAATNDESDSVPESSKIERKRGIMDILSLLRIKLGNQRPGY